MPPADQPAAEQPVGGPGGDPPAVLKPDGPAPPIDRLFGDDYATYLLEPQPGSTPKFILRVRRDRLEQFPNGITFDPFTFSLGASVGRIAAAAVSSGELHAFLDSGTYKRWTSSGMTLGPALPPGVLRVPYAVCAAHPPGALYAVLSDGPVATAPASTQPRVGDAPWLWALQRGRWMPVDTTPALFDPGLKMAADRDGVWLIGQVAGVWQVWKSDRLPIPPIQRAEQAARLGEPVIKPIRWSPVRVPSALGGMDPAEVTALTVDDKLVLIIRQPRTEPPNTHLLHFWWMAGGQWQDGFARSDNGNLAFPDNATWISSGFGHVAVVYDGPPMDPENPDSNRPLMFRQFDLDGRPEGAPVRLFVWSDQPENNWQGVAFLMLHMTLLAVIILALYAFRRDEMLHLVVLPPGVTLASRGARLGAFLIDILPAIAIALIVHGDPLMDLWRDLFAAAGQGGEVHLNATQHTMMVSFVWTVFGIYGMGTIISELATGSTPGKRVLGLRVQRYDGKPPTPGQVILRGFWRVLEINVWPPITATYYLLVFFLLSRNRQRLGDIIARTVVVQPLPAGQTPTPPAPPGGKKES